MNITETKSALVQTVLCEVDMLKRGNLKCANKMLGFRNAAQLRIFMIEAMQSEENGAVVYKEVIDYLFEQVKELTRFITQTNC